MTQCPILADQHHPDAVGQIEFQTRATITPRTVAGQEVVIDVEALSAFTKITSFELERYPNGIIKSVNAKVDDRTADVAKEAFKAVVSIGKIAIGLPTPSATSAGLTRRSYFLACSVGASAQVAAMPALRQAVKDRDAAFTQADEALKAFNQKHPVATRKGPLVNQAAQLERAQMLAKESQAAAGEALTKALDDITVVSRFTYVPGQTSTDRPVLAARHAQGFKVCRGEKPATPAASEINGVYNSLVDAVSGTTSPQSIVQLRSLSSDRTGKSRWLVHTLGPDLTFDCNQAVKAQARWSDGTGQPGAAERAEIAAAVQAVWENPIALDEISSTIKRLQATDVLITAHTLSSARAPLALGATPTCTADGNQRCGILYRTPLPARLRICRYLSDTQGIPNPEQCHALSSTDPAVLVTDERPIPQLGHLASLGLRNGPFTNNELSASFNEDGSLITMSYKKPRAEAVAIGETVNSGLDAVTAIKLYSNGRELRELADDKAVADAQVALLNARKALVQPREITTLENQASLLKAQGALIDAQIQLHKKQAELDALNASTEGSAVP
ncbi:hypothetical protein [Pseudomonas sp. SDO5271_S396]